MNDGIGRSYPAIDRALNVLRSRLLAEKIDLEAKNDSAGVEISNETPSPMVLKEELRNHANKLVKETGCSFISMNVLPAKSLKDLVIRSAQRAFKTKPSSNAQAKRIHGVPPEILGKIEQAYIDYLQRRIFSSWKVFWCNKKMQRLAYIATSVKLSNAYDTIRRILPDAVRLRCMQRLGKAKLAEHFHALQVKRNVFIALLNYAATFES